MGVEGQHAVVHLMSLTIGIGLSYEPLEQGLSLSHALWMPLHTENAFVFSTLYCLNDTVRSRCRDTELAARIADGLMVEGVDMNCQLRTED